MNKSRKYMICLKINQKKESSIILKTMWNFLWWQNGYLEKVKTINIGGYLKN